jgi:ubiquinol-cytochrome c reductase cytochrome b subunit
MGALPPEGIYLLVARIATAYYFIHFLIILPILGRKERTLNVPLSITEPVLEDFTNQSLTKEQINKQ